MTQAHFDLEQAWAGNVPSHWRWSRNKELLAESLSVSPEGTEELLSVSHLTGITPRSEKNVTMTAAESLEGYRLVDAGDLVINTMWAWMGALGVSKQAGIVSPAYGVYRPRPNAAFCPGFYDYLYRSTPYVMEMTRLSRGIWSSRLRIYPDVFLSMAIPVPPLEEQRAIADYLDRETARIDTLIEEQQRLIEMLRERRWSVVERSVALLDWNTPLKAVTALIQTGPFGSQLKSDEYEDGGMPIINPSHIVAGEVVPDPRVAVGADKAAQLARHALEEGDLIAARRGELGRCAVVEAPAVGFLCGTGSALVRFNRAFIEPAFGAVVFSSRRNRDALALASVGSTMDNLNSDIIGSLRIPVPSLEEQRALVAEVGHATAKIDTLIEETGRFIEFSKERRSALITAAVTGQIDVHEVP
ncbi:restriction endonuclease subunit S [Streptomyces sp. TLI_185]|uniref:restriction endonuclease subunit S n=1 Tax=Streptomyces sp. TLI_185 TaxID=2485151 RepID=UPI000FA678E5|nr:restriction endonuclease subunit S [Streptomyces sp. TLI_185]RPF35983.1 type I restriction enzyme S subunit [Streptomyces sp. TLI_185]